MVGIYEELERGSRITPPDRSVAFALLKRSRGVVSGEGSPPGRNRQLARAQGGEGSSFFSGNFCLGKVPVTGCPLWPWRVPLGLNGACCSFSKHNLWLQVSRYNDDRPRVSGKLYRLRCQVPSNKTRQRRHANSMTKKISYASSCCLLVTIPV